MIPIEQQVVSLELSKKLKELRVKQKSYFTWIPVVKYTGLLELDSQMQMERGWGVDHMVPPPHVERYSAFTVAELGEMLGKAFRQLKGTMIMDPRGRFKRLWQKITGFDDEANDRAKLLIYLLENRLCKPDL